MADAPTPRVKAIKSLGRVRTSLLEEQERIKSLRDEVAELQAENDRLKNKINNAALNSPSSSTPDTNEQISELRSELNQANMVKQRLGLTVDDSWANVMMKIRTNRIQEGEAVKQRLDAEHGEAIQAKDANIQHLQNRVTELENEKTENQAGASMQSQDSAHEESIQAKDAQIHSLEVKVAKLEKAREVPQAHTSLQGLVSSQQEDLRNKTNEITYLRQKVAVLEKQLEVQPAVTSRDPLRKAYEQAIRKKEGTYQQAMRQKDAAHLEASRKKDAKYLEVLQQKEVATQQIVQRKDTEIDWLRQQLELAKSSTGTMNDEMLQVKEAEVRSLGEKVEVMAQEKANLLRQAQEYKTGIDEQLEQARKVASEAQDEARKAFDERNTALAQLQVAANAPREIIIAMPTNPTEIQQAFLREAKDWLEIKKREVAQVVQQSAEEVRVITKERDSLAFSNRWMLDAMGTLNKKVDAEKAKNELLERKLANAENDIIVIRSDLSSKEQVKQHLRSELLKKDKELGQEIWLREWAERAHGRLERENEALKEHVENLECTIKEWDIEGEDVFYDCVEYL